MARPLPQLDAGIHIDEAYRLLLAGNTGVLATAEGTVRDIITRIDLIHYWNQSRPALILMVRTPDEPTTHVFHNHGFSTLAIHAGQGGRPRHRGDRGSDLRDLDRSPVGPGRAKGFEGLAQRQPYPRRRWRRVWRPAEGGRAGPGIRPGLAATTAVFSLLRPGDEELPLAADLYGGTYRLLERVLKPWGLIPQATDDPRPKVFKRLSHQTTPAPLDRDADESAAPGPGHRCPGRSWRHQAGVAVARGGQHVRVALLAAAARPRGRPRRSTAPPSISAATQT